MIWATNRYVKIWKIFEAKEKYCDMSVGTSEKKQGSKQEYENSHWSARVIGKAFQQLKKGDIVEGEQYAVVSGKLTNVRYKDDDGKYHDNYRWLILEFAPAGSTESASIGGDTEKKSGSKKSASKPVDVSAEDEETDPW